MYITIVLYIVAPLSLTSLELIKWRDQHGHERTFRLVDKVSSKWRAFGSRVSLEPDQLEAWETRFQRDSTRCWCMIMQHWLNRGGTHDYPKTWDGLYKMLRDVQCSEVANELKEAVTSPAITRSWPVQEEQLNVFSRFCGIN